MLAQERLGAAVRSARESAGLSVEQVSARTRIRPGVLRDLEAGSTVRCGGSAYARGHLRALATVTGVDPEVLVAALVAAGGDPDGVDHRDRLAGPGAHRSQLVLPPAPPEAGPPRWGVAAAVAAGAVAVLLLVGAPHGAPPQAPATALPAPAATSPSAPVAPAPPPPATSLRLQVDQGRSWVTVLTATGRPLFRGVLDAGSVREFTDPSPLSFMLGNAGVVTVGCGGSSAAAGSSAKVRRFTCAPDGLAPA